MAGLYLLCMLCKINSLRVAIAVIETASDYFADTKRIILVPLLFFIFKIVWIAVWIIAIFGVASIGPIEVRSI